MGDERKQAKELWAKLSPKQKWDYFWEYYRIHVYAGILFVFLLGITIRDCAMRVDPDITIAYVGTELHVENLAQAEAALSEMISDINGDGKPIVSIQQIIDERKLFVMIAARELQLMFTRSEEFQRYAANGAFVPLDAMLEDMGIELNLDTYPEVVLTPNEAQEQHIYGIPLEQNAFFAQFGATMPEMYLAMMILHKDSDKPKEVALYTDTLAIVQELLKNSAPSVMRQP
jgi:hypothetical protein